MSKVRKTITININTYNETIKKMRATGFYNFSKYVDFVLTQQIDELYLITAQMKHHQRRFMHFAELRENLEEQLKNPKAKKVKKAKK